MLLFPFQILACGSFRLHGRLQLCAKDVVPELAGDAETQFVVEEVVLQVILLELLVPEREILMVQEVVRQVVADIAKDAAAVDGRAEVPVVREDDTGQLPEWCGQHNEERGGHDQTVLVHRQVVVDAVEEEVEGDANSVVRKVAI